MTCDVSQLCSSKGHECSPFDLLALIRGCLLSHLFPSSCVLADAYFWTVLRVEAAGDETQEDVQNLVRDKDLRLSDFSLDFPRLHLCKKLKFKPKKNPISKLKLRLEGVRGHSVVTSVEVLSLTCHSGFRHLQLPQPSRIQGFLPG